MKLEKVVWEHRNCWTMSCGHAYHSVVVRDQEDVTGCDTGGDLKGSPPGGRGEFEERRSWAGSAERLCQMYSPIRRCRLALRYWS